MKIAIEKVPGTGSVKLSITYATSKAPLVITLTPDQAESFISLIRMAFQADNFKFEYQP